MSMEINAPADLMDAILEYFFNSEVKNSSITIALELRF
jgi:hypothetical protein